MSEADRVLALIGEPDRLRVFSALALGAATTDDIVRMTSLEARAVERALARLVSGELVGVESGRYRLMTEEILVAARAAARERAAEPAEGEILGRFLKGGRLVSIPASRSKRLVVLDHLAQRFQPGRRYDEREVNVLLGEYHEDVASLRRYLVDEGFLERRGGQYWRAGGTFEVE